MIIFDAWNRGCRFLAASRGAAVTALAALLLTLLLVWIANQYRFVEDVVWPLRLFLFAALAGAIAFTLAIPLGQTQPQVRHKAC